MSSILEQDEKLKYLVDMDRGQVYSLQVYERGY